MPYQYLLHKEAHEEYIKAYEWYELRKTGLGEKFMAFVVEKKLFQISDIPSITAKGTTITEKLRLRTFPT